MKVLTKILAGGVAAAALFTAAPAAAQYYPGNPYGGYGYGYGGNVVGQVLNQVLGGGYGYGGYGGYGGSGGYGGYGGYGGSGGYGGYGGYGYGANSQAAVGQCANAVQARLQRNGSYGGGYGSPYGYNGYGQARVLGISRVEQRSGGGLTVRGVASSGLNAGYAYGGQQSADLTWKCKIDYRGYVSDIDIERARGAYGYNNQYNNPYAPQNAYDYSQYGYRRY